MYVKLGRPGQEAAFTVNGADEEVLSALQQHAATYLGLRGQDLPEELRRLLRARILTSA
ncbi:MAG: hypothetical protein U0Y82_16260 [Thermoleophilia bacterium]